MARGLRTTLGRLRSFGQETGGASAVEFALVLPVLLALTLGALDGGRALLAINTLEKLAKEGARYASVRGSEYATPADEAVIRALVEGRATGLRVDNLVVSADWPNGPWPAGNDPGDPVTVTVTYPFDALFLKFQAFTFTRSSTLSIMR